MPGLVIWVTIPYWLEQCHRPWHSELSASQYRGSCCLWTRRPLSPCHQRENWGSPAHETGRSDKAGLKYLIKSLCQSAPRSVELLMSNMNPDLQVNKGLDNETMWQTLCRKPTVVITRVNTSSLIFFISIPRWCEIKNANRSQKYLFLLFFYWLCIMIQNCLTFDQQNQHLPLLIFLFY